MKPKYPEIEVDLSGEDGNAFMIMGRVRKAMRQAGVPNGRIEQFTADCQSGDYNHLLQTCMRWVTCN